MTKRSAEAALRDEVRAASEEVAARTRVLETERKRTTAALDRRRIADERVAESTARRDRAQAALDALLPLPLAEPDPADVITDAADGETVDEAVPTPIERATSRKRA